MDGLLYVWEGGGKGGWKILSVAKKKKTSYYNLLKNDDKMSENRKENGETICSLVQ